MDRVLFSRKSDHWATPVDVYEALYQEFQFCDDPCPLRSEPIGLDRAWGKRVFCNPPYSNIRDFLDKGLAEMACGNTAVLVFLVPARTDTRWFHDCVLPTAEIRFIKGRLKFGGASHGAPFPSMICIFTKKSPT